MKIKKTPFLCDQKLKENVKNTKLNAFEIHINRSKYQILGRKLKCEKGLPGISKRKDIEKRRKTLFYEYHNRNKNNQLIDHRIGENNSNIDHDNKIMMRFTAERMCMYNKKSVFNLCKSESITHKGQTLRDIERFDSSNNEEDEEDNNGILQKNFVERAHFGGGMLAKCEQSRESLIEELINESKKRKADRQYIKEETLAATEQLDKDWQVLGPIVTEVCDTKSVVKIQIMEPSVKRSQSYYDLLINQLKFPCDDIVPKKIKENEIITHVNKNPLNIENFNMVEATENENLSNEPQYNEKRCKDNLTELMQLINNQRYNNLGELLSLIPTEELDSKFNITVSENLKVQNNNRPITKPDMLDKLFGIIIPNSYQLFKDSFHSTKLEKKVVLLEQLVKNSHISNGPEYKAAMLKLCENVMQFLEEGSFTWENLQLYVMQFSFLKHNDNKKYSERILSKLEYLCNSSSLTSFALKYLVCVILLYLNIQDREELHKQKLGLALASKLLSQLDCSSRHHAASGLLCCYLLLQNSKRDCTIYMDAVRFLLECIKIYGKKISSADISNSDTKDSGKTVSKNKSDMLNLKIYLQNENESCIEEDNIAIVYIGTIFVKEFIKAYNKYPECKIWLKCIESSLTGFDMEVFPSPVKEQMIELKALIVQSQSILISTLAKLAKKPKILCQYEPLYKSNYLKTEKCNESIPFEKQVTKKLLHRYKKERKGAIRELRKDRIFLANIKLKEQFQCDEERKRKVKLIHHYGALQQGEFRQHR